MGQRILYIEDNADNRLLVRRILEAAGYQVLEAATGLAGIKTAITHQPHLILVDINLPDIDGYEVTRRLRQQTALLRVPIMAVTANVLKGDRERTLAAGCNMYLSKPIDVDTLPQQIAQLLRLPKH